MGINLHRTVQRAPGSRRRRSACEQFWHCELWGREAHREQLGSDAGVIKMEATVTIEQTFDGAIIKVTTQQCDWIKQHPTCEDAIAEAVRLGLVTKRIASALANRGNRFLGEVIKVDYEALSKNGFRKINTESA